MALPAKACSFEILMAKEKREYGFRISCHVANSFSTAPTTLWPPPPWPPHPGQFGPWPP